MAHFSVGEQVIIRYGKHQGKKATVLRSQPDDAYRVKAEDGTILFFSSKGLEKDRVQKAVSDRLRGQTRPNPILDGLV